MLEAVGLSDPGCVRSNNEDYYLLSPAIELYLVADGMGGANGGEHASKIASETVAGFLDNLPERNSQSLREAINEANRCVLKAAEEDPSLHGMGTTLTAVCPVGDQLEVASVGDSRAYLLEDGQLRVITQDQTWVNEVGRRMGISEDALKNHPMRHHLTMAVGISDNLRVHSYCVPWKVGSQCLLCSDGLHGVIEDQQILETLSSEKTLEDKCRNLIEAAKRAGGPDNITAVLLEFRS